jgi:hypothetical protein
LYEIFDHIFPEKPVQMDEYERNLQKKEDCPRNRRSSQMSSAKKE